MDVTLSRFETEKRSLKENVIAKRRCLQSVAPALENVSTTQQAKMHKSFRDHDAEEVLKELLGYCLEQKMEDI